MPVWTQRSRFLLFPLVLKLDSVIARRIFKISWPEDKLPLLLCASEVIYGVCDVHQGGLMLEYLRMSRRCCGDDFLSQLSQWCHGNHTHKSVTAAVISFQCGLLLHMTSIRWAHVASWVNKSAAAIKPQMNQDHVTPCQCSVGSLSSSNRALFRREVRVNLPLTTGPHELTAQLIPAKRSS